MKSRVIVVRKASKKLILGYAMYIILLGGLTVEVLASLDKSWQVNEQEEESIPVTATKTIETTNTLTNTTNENFQISPSFFKAFSSFSALPLDISQSGSLPFPTEYPISDNAFFTGIGFVSENRTSEISAISL